MINAEVLGYLDPLDDAARHRRLRAAPPWRGGIRGTRARAGDADEAAGASCWSRPSRSPRGTPAEYAGRRAPRPAARSARVALMLPFAAVGALPNMWLAFGSFYARRDILSGYAANVWWIANYGLRAYYQIPRLGFPHAFLVEVRRIMAVSTFQEVGLPEPAPVRRRGGRSDRRLGPLAPASRDATSPSHLLAAAFLVHAYLRARRRRARASHDAGGAAARARRRAAPSPPAALLRRQRIVALNMNLFYGIGMGAGLRGAPPAARPRPHRHPLGRECRRPRLARAHPVA